MSHYTINHLLERAADLIDELQSHPAGADRQIMDAISNNDYDRLYELVTKYEGLLYE